MTLRIHRGNKNQRQNQNSDITISNSLTNLDSFNTNSVGVTSMSSFERKKRHGSRHKDKVTISISYPSTDHIASPTISTTSSKQMISSCSKEPISLRQSSSSDCPDSQNLFRENINSCSPKNEFSPNSSGKKGKRTISGAKAQVRKFRMETKAAKTLAIIVGK